MRMEQMNQSIARTWTWSFTADIVDDLYSNENRVQYSRITFLLAGKTNVMMSIFLLVVETRKKRAQEDRFFSPYKETPKHVEKFKAQ